MGPYKHHPSLNRNSCFRVKSFFEDKFQNTIVPLMEFKKNIILFKKRPTRQIRLFKHFTTLRLDFESPKTGRPERWPFKIRADESALPLTFAKVQTYEKNNL